MSFDFTFLNIFPSKMDLLCTSSPPQHRRRGTEHKFRNRQPGKYHQRKIFFLEHWLREPVTAFVLLFQWLIIIPVKQWVPLSPVAPVAHFSASVEFFCPHCFLCTVLCFRRKEPRTHSRSCHRKDEEKV